jgi:hypothetical protein
MKTVLRIIFASLLATLCAAAANTGVFLAAAAQMRAADTRKRRPGARLGIGSESLFKSICRGIFARDGGNQKITVFSSFRPVLRTSLLRTPWGPIRVECTPRFPPGLQRSQMSIAKRFFVSHRVIRSGAIVALSACLVAVVGSQVGATMLSPGSSIFAHGEDKPIGGTILAGTGAPIAFSSPTFTGSLTSTVISGDTSNALGGLTFTYLVTNNNASPDQLERFTVDNFAGFLTDGSYQSPGGGVAPTVNDRSLSGNVIGFTFDGPPVSALGTILPGSSSALLVIQTNAAHYGLTSANVIDGSVASVASFAPINSVPEPSTLALALFAVLGWAAFARRRAR